jgi:hypothetical protein
MAGPESKAEAHRDLESRTCLTMPSVRTRSGATVPGIVHPSHSAGDDAAGPAGLSIFSRPPQPLKRLEVKPNAPRPGWLATGAEIWAERPLRGPHQKSLELAILLGNGAMQRSE